MQDYINANLPLSFNRTGGGDSGHGVYTITPFGKNRVRQLDDKDPQFLILATLEELGSGNATEVGKNCHMSSTKAGHYLRLLAKIGCVRLESMGG